MIKILLVEDSKFLRLATCRALCRAGYETCVASDGKQAVKLAREQLPELILLDLLLPGLSGPDVLKELKKDPATAKIPVVVLSGMSQNNAARLEHDGAFAFLQKSELGLDRGAGILLQRIQQILQQLGKRAKAASTP